MQDLFFNNQRSLCDYLNRFDEFPNQGIQTITYHNYHIVVKHLLKPISKPSDSILKMRELYFKRVYLVRAFIYLNDEITAYITDYAKGYTLSNHQIYKVSLINILNAISLLQEDLKELARYNLLVNDAHTENILFDKNKFNLIDTIDYQFLNIPQKRIEEENLQEVFNEIWYNIFPLKLSNFLLSKNMIDHQELYSNPRETFEYVFTYLEHEFNETFNTIYEANRIYTQK